MKCEYRRVSMRNLHGEHYCTAGGGSIVLIHTSVTWNVTNANFLPNSFTESIISDGKDCSLWHHVDIDSLVTRSVSLSFLFRSDPPRRRGKSNENKTRSKRKGKIQKKKKRNPSYFTTEKKKAREEKAQQIKIIIKNFYLERNSEKIKKKKITERNIISIVEQKTDIKFLS